jgi:hypothetical protein
MRKARNAIAILKFWKAAKDVVLMSQCGGFKFDEAERFIQPCRSVYSRLARSTSLTHHRPSSNNSLPSLWIRCLTVTLLFFELEDLHCIFYGGFHSVGTTP